MWYQQKGEIGEGSGNQAEVVHFWAFSKFKERLEMMRDIYSLVSSAGMEGSWHGRDNPLEDPWLEPSLADIQQRLLELTMTEQKLAELKVAEAVASATSHGA